MRDHSKRRIGNTTTSHRVMVRMMVKMMVRNMVMHSLRVKLKVVSRSAEQPFYPKSVGARGFFQIAPTPVDKSVSH